MREGLELTTERSVQNDQKECGRSKANQWKSPPGRPNKYTKDVIKKTILA